MSKILIVDDDPAIRRLLSYNLQKWDYKILELDNGSSLTPEYINVEKPDAIFLDIKLPGRSGTDALVEIHAEFPDLPVVMITAHGSVDIAVECMKKGAYDFIEKPVDLTRLRLVATNAVKTSQMSRKITKLERDVDRKTAFCGIVGASDAMQKIYEVISVVCESNASVLITGESGTGKELAARAIHKKSGSSRNKLVEVNCGAIPRDLIESELFGHEKGAFTGAAERRIGTIEQADGGTLFLDEICEMELNLQVKLLRFLQERYIQRVGGGNKIDVDTRLISATNKNPLEEIKAGRFRDDLYYRLNVIPLHLPALRERFEDVPLLSIHFLEEFSSENGKSFESFTTEALELLMKYPWPGNVRELRNTIQRIVVMNREPIVTADMIPVDIRNNQREDYADFSVTAPQSDSDIATLDQIKKEHFTRALKLCGGSVPGAAKKLGIGTNTLYRAVKEFGIEI